MLTLVPFLVLGFTDMVYFPDSRRLQVRVFNFFILNLRHNTFLSFFPSFFPPSYFWTSGRRNWATNATCNGNWQVFPGKPVVRDSSRLKPLRRRAPVQAMMRKMFINNRKSYNPQSVQVPNMGPRLHPLYGICGVQFGFLCSCVYCDFEFLKFVFSTLLSRSCWQLTNSCLLRGLEGSLLWIDMLSFLLPIWYIFEVVCWVFSTLNMFLLACLSLFSSCQLILVLKSCV